MEVVIRKFCREGVWHEGMDIGVFGSRGRLGERKGADMIDGIVDILTEVQSTRGG